MLEVRDLTAGYGKVAALRSVSITVPTGAFAVIIGPNGAGKTTFMKAIVGLHPATGGDVLLNGERIDSLDPAKVVRRGLSLVPEGRHVLRSLSVDDNLRLGALTNGRRRRECPDLAFEYFPELHSLRARRASTLSGGEQQMLAIARSMMASPTMLALDEPTLGLAPRVVDRVFDAVERLHRDGTDILLVEQNSLRALELASIAFTFHKGEVGGVAVHEQLSDDAGRRAFADIHHIDEVDPR